MSGGGKQVVTVCVGSSCHIKGAREVIARFHSLLEEHGLTGKVELQASFCMERCGEGINWQINDTPFTSRTVEEAVETFKKHILREGEKGG